MILRPYQDESLNALYAHIAAARRKIMLCAPTGSGKTVIAAAFITGALERNEVGMLLAHRKELLRQPFCRLLRAGVDPSLIGIRQAGVGKAPRREPTVDASASDWVLWRSHAYARPDAPIQIASIDTLNARRDYPPCDWLIIDEAHGAIAPKFRLLMHDHCGAHEKRELLDDGMCEKCGATPARLVRAPYADAVIIGLSATPSGRTDGRGLDEIFDELVVVSSYLELAGMGFLVVPKVYGTAEAPDLSNVKRSGSDYHRAQLADACDQRKLVGNIVEHWQRRTPDVPTLCFATSVKHSHNIVEAFTEAGVTAAHVDGDTPGAERDKIFEQLTTGAIRVVSNVDIAGEGTDLPCVQCVIMARPTLSLRVYLQQGGRGSRPPGPYTILDHAGNASNPELGGLPQDDREWSLLPRVKKRRTAGDKLPPTYRCEGCDAMVPVTEPVCPACDTPRPQRVRRMIATVAGELQLLNAPGIAAECWAMLVDEWHQKNAERLAPLKRDWCPIQFHKRYGTRPRNVQLPTYTPDEQWRHDTARECRNKAFAQFAGKGNKGRAMALANTWLKKAVERRWPPAPPQTSGVGPENRPTTGARDVASDAPAGRGTITSPQQSPRRRAAQSKGSAAPLLPGMERWV